MSYEAELNKLAEMSDAKVVKDAVQALSSNDSVKLRQLQKDFGPEPQSNAFQLACLVELLPLTTLSGVKSEVQRKTLIEGCKASFLVSLNRVAFAAQKSRDSGLKAWGEQAQIVFASMSGSEPMTARKHSPKASTTTAAASAPVAPIVEPSISVDGNKIVIKNYRKQSDPIDVSDNLSMHSSIIICDCSETVFRLAGDCLKITALQIDNCSSVGVVTGRTDIIASIDVVNSKKCQLESHGHIPTLNIDCCDGLTVYLLSTKAKDISIVTSRSSELNIVHPMGWERPMKTVKRTEQRSAKRETETTTESTDSADNSEFKDTIEDVSVEELVEDEDAEIDTVEVSVPVQFRSYFDCASGLLVTEPLQHTGGN